MNTLNIELLNFVFLLSTDTFRVISNGALRNLKKILSQISEKHHIFVNTQSLEKERRLNSTNVFLFVD